MNYGHQWSYNYFPSHFNFSLLKVEVKAEAAATYELKAHANLGDVDEGKVKITVSHRTDSVTLSLFSTLSLSISLSNQEIRWTHFG